MNPPHSLPLTSALLIKSPWIELILDGEKTWEMRRRSTTKVNEWIALVASGSGKISGVALLKQALPPIEVADYGRHFDQHRVPPHEVLPNDPYVVPWVMERATWLLEHVPYAHPSGAVTWVRLKPETVAAIARQVPFVAGGKEP